MVKCRAFRYKSSVIFGDTNFHSVCELDELGLSREDPLAIIIGSTTSVESGVISLSSVWLWRYNFSSANSHNFWSSDDQYGANGSSVPSGVSTGTYYNCDGTSLIPEAYITSGSDSSITKFALNSVYFYSSNDWAFTPDLSSYPSTALNRAMIMRFNDNRLFELRSDMYSISGTTITWNMNHPLMVLMRGLKCYPVVNV